MHRELPVTSRSIYYPADNVNKTRLATPPSLYDFSAFSFKQKKNEKPKPSNTCLWLITCELSTWCSKSGQAKSGKGNCLENLYQKGGMSSSPFTWQIPLMFYSFPVTIYCNTPQGVPKSKCCSIHSPTPQFGVFFWFFDDHRHKFQKAATGWPRLRLATSFTWSWAEM